MALSTEDTARLAALKAARDLAISGGTVTRVTSGGRTVENAPADPAAIQREIDRLEAQAVGTMPIRRRGALHFRV